MVGSPVLAPPAIVGAVVVSESSLLVDVGDSSEGAAVGDKTLPERVGSLVEPLDIGDSSEGATVGDKPFPEKVGSFVEPLELLGTFVSSDGAAVGEITGNVGKNVWPMKVGVGLKVCQWSWTEEEGLKVLPTAVGSSSLDVGFSVGV